MPDARAPINLATTGPKFNTEKIRPRLIGGFGRVNALLGYVPAELTCVSDGSPAPSPTYYRPMVSAVGLVLSVDSVRLDLTLRDSTSSTAGAVPGEVLQAKLEMLPGRVYFSRGGLRPGQWRWLGTFDCDSSDSAPTCTVGIGLTDANGVADYSRAFADFNPNKCAFVGSRLWDVLRLLSAYCRRSPDCVRVSRWDLACDLPISRDSCRLVKDRRKYSCEVSGALTEYFGARNSPGRVKLYDKQSESGLSRPLTRLEVTCSGSDSVADVLDRVPLVCGYSVPPDGSGLRATTRVLLLLLAERLAQGLPVADYLAQLDPRFRRKLSAALWSGSMLSLDAATVSDLMRDCVDYWVRLLLNGCDVDAASVPPEPPYDGPDLPDWAERIFVASETW